MPLLPTLHGRFFQLLLLFLIYITTSHAITGSQFVQTFNIDNPIRGPGGCGRISPNGVDMLPHTVNAVSDAFDMIAAVQSQIKLFRFYTPDAQKLRRLLFLFFGITYGDVNQINVEKVQNYTFVQGTTPTL